MKNSHTGLSNPPEGAIVGESVHPGSEPDRFDEAMIQKTVGILKGNGKPFVSMSDSEIREKAIEFLRKCGADL